MKHVYLAPHLDDAVLSCGGAIHRHALAGDPVLVVTIFAGEFQGTNPPPFALEQHGYWGNPPRPMTLRRAEDTAALAFLDAEVRHLDYGDAVYRSGPDGCWLYDNEDALFGDVHPGDPLIRDGTHELQSQLAETIPAKEGTVVYAPLGAGHHVDHQIVHMAAQRLQVRGYQLAFYEDYPYGERAGAVEAALASGGPGHWRPETLSLDVQDLTAKVSALAYYRTQMSILFGGAEQMPGRVWAFAVTRAPDAKLAERIWWPLLAQP
jgi:LmbE family N-acetylglucosaminyl deacetylase